jgi:hypothetical protein
MASDVAEYLSAAGQVADSMERHPVLTVSIVLLLVCVGTPEIGPADKPWVRSRPGIGWLVVKAIEAYAERTQVFRSIEDEVKAFREEMSALGKRVGEGEKVVSWQTQVLMAISSALKIDVLTLLGKHDSPVIPIARESVAEVSGKKGEKHAEAPVVPS